MLSSDRYGPAMVLYGVNEHRKVQFFIKEKKKKKKLLVSHVRETVSCKSIYTHILILIPISNSSITV